MTMTASRKRDGRHGRKAASAAFVVAGLVSLLASALPARAADTPPTGGRIVTMTRGMKVFGDAEYALIQALAAKDKAALDALVDETFEQRGGPNPGEGVPRDEWLPKAQAESSNGDRITQMAVHDMGELALVSFLLQRPGKGDAFVVDVWKKQAGSDKAVLQIRYFSAAAVPARKPGAKPSAPVVDTKK
jgi:hypothetical protein